MITKYGLLFQGSNSLSSKSENSDSFIFLNALDETSIAVPVPVEEIGKLTVWVGKGPVEDKSLRVFSNFRWDASNYKTET
jgi:hypothetical protein